MTFQITAIVLYSNRGDRRILSLEPDKLNIITGGSRTGKTALIDIVDFCLGRSDFNIPDGVIRDTVAWYALKLVTPTSEVFIAREKPVGKSNSAVYLQVGRDVEIPDADELVSSTSGEAAEGILSDLMGLEDISSSDLPDLPSFRITVRHSSFFLYQRQDEVLSRDFLFHRQNEEWAPRVIRDVLPFFLGAITPRDLATSRQINKLRLQVRRLMNTLRERRQIADSGGHRGRLLLAEAAQLGLLPASTSEGTISENNAKLRQLLESADSLTSTAFQEDGGREDGRPSLLNERRRLMEQYRAISERLDFAKKVVEERSIAAVEEHEQLSRMRLASLMPDRTESATCPLCSSALDGVIPAIEELNERLEEISSGVVDTSEALPAGSIISRLTDEIQAVRGQIANNARALEQLERSDSEIRQALDQRQVWNRFIGKVQLYLDSTSEEDFGDLELHLRLKSAELSELEASIDREVIEARLDAILGRLGAAMSEWARHLELEHSAYPVRLDPRELTAVVYKPDRSVPLSNMGSGENYVAYHLVSLLALHQWFASENRPVPRFLFLDQPSEVYFPSDREFRDAKLPPGESDRVLVERMLRLIYDAVQESPSGFQVILTEHADIDVDWFNDSLAERWREGEALIPREWVRAEGDG